MSKGHIIVGATGTGKSTYIKGLLDKANKQALYIYDVNNEYVEYFPYPFTDFETFLEGATKLKKSIQVYEEATIFLNNRSCNKEIINLLTRKRHTLNYIILVFHSMRAVPRYIYELSNYITIFKTNDSPEMTTRELKDDRIGNIMETVKNSLNPHYYYNLKIY